MRRIGGRRGRWRAAAWPALLIVSGALIAWIVVRREGGTTTDVAAAIAVLVALAGIAERQLQKHSEADARPAPQGLDAAQLDAWRARLRTAVRAARVEQGGQLDQMIPHGEAISVKTKAVDDARRPRLRVGGKLLDWSEITSQWETSQDRLVILGEPGYGKTVAALTLISHINARDEVGVAVAELFSLAHWDFSEDDERDTPLAEWLAEQLTAAYPADLPQTVSRQLIDEGLVLPVLDGLDEIPSLERRRACVDAINAYTRRAPPHRPFVLTCRVLEYTQLAPEWVGADQIVMLVGLQSDQVEAILAERTKGRAGWNVIRAEYASGNATLHDVFRSPLRIAIALQAYRDRDPVELIGLTVAEARGRLWELLLTTTADAYKNASSSQVRTWLEFLASSMRRTARQRLMLHELYLIVPDPSRELQGQRLVAVLVVASVGGAGATFAAGLGHAWGLALGVGSAALFVPFGARGVGAAPTTAVRLGVKARARTAAVNLRLNLLGGLGLGLVLGLITGSVIALSSGVRVGAAVAGVLALSGLAMGIASLVDNMVTASHEVIRSEPPSRFLRKGPETVLAASRTNGLRRGLIFATGGSVSFAIAGGVGLGLVGEQVDALGGALAFGLVGGLICGLDAGLLGGLDAWLYHYWLRVRLRTRHQLPLQLPRFLRWCAEPQRGLLRITNAYEFRHRELLEYLAPESPPAADDMRAAEEPVGRPEA